MKNIKRLELSIEAGWYKSGIVIAVSNKNIA